MEYDKSVVEIKPEIDVNLFFGLLLMPLIPFANFFLGDRTLEELKYYIEHGQPHPRKLKALQKQMKTA